MKGKGETKVKNTSDKKLRDDSQSSRSLVEEVIALAKKSDTKWIEKPRSAPTEPKTD